MARRTGVRPSAIRYYEKLGLLSAPLRASGRRRYGEDVLGRLAAVRLAREAGFTLAEIGVLLHGFPEGTAPQTRWRRLAGPKLRQIDELIAAAEQRRRLLLASLDCGCATLQSCAAASQLCGGDGPRSH